MLNPNTGNTNRNDQSRVANRSFYNFEPMNRLKNILLAVLSLVLLVSCNDDNRFNPNKDPLTGMIGGKEWTYGSGNANYSFIDGAYTGLVLRERVEDPCTRVISSADHLTITFPPMRGVFNLPYIPNSNNTADVIFRIQGGARYTATSGFIEIVDITSTEVVGFISADYDEKNFIEGSFLLRLCN